VIAICIGLVALAAGTTGFMVTLGIWLHSANASRDTLRDTLDATERVSNEWEHKYESQLNVAKAAMSDRDAERSKRQIVEAQLTAAQERLADLLRRYLRNATDEEIREISRDVFTFPLSVVPVPITKDDDADGLLNPYADRVPPA
jgi:hypothetical protein